MTTATGASLDEARGGPVLLVDEQYDDAAQQRESATLGMWVFLTTETLFFGALFFAYAIARVQFPDAFGAASRHTDIVLGTANTAILLTSSLFMALAVRSAAFKARGATVVLLLVTAALGTGLRGHQAHRVREGLPRPPGAGAQFRFRGPARGRSAGVLRPLLRHDRAPRSCTSWSASPWCWDSRGRCTRGKRNALGDHVEVIGLYWHFVDVVWIFLYPCLYLVSRA